MNSDAKALIYIFLGALPATAFGFPALLLLLTLKWEAFIFALFVLIAVAGLWMASFDASPALSRKRLIIATSLVIGLILIMPVTTIYTFGFFTEPTGYFIKHIKMYYLTHGPVIIAIHYLMTSIYRIASNKSLNNGRA